jgi:carboxymethylenebutenolidase
MKTDDGHSVMPLSRRAFAASGLVTGFTLAAGPVRADAIITDSNGLDAGEVAVPVSDRTVPSYRAKPQAGTNHPVMLVVQEVFGVHEHIKDICRRFAKLGFYAIAPSLYARYGDPGKYDMSTVQKLMTDIVVKVPDAGVMSDLDASVAFATREGADTTKLGVIGFCCGARILRSAPGTGSAQPVAPALSPRHRERPACAGARVLWRPRQGDSGFRC